jgi:hypothetical protein
VITAGGSIGELADPFLVNANDPQLAGAGDGTVFAIANAGDIFIESPGPLRISGATAGSSDRQVSFNAAGLLEATVAGLSDDNWHLRGANNISLVAGGSAGIRFSQIKDLESSAAGAIVTLHATAGPIVVDVLHDSSSTDPDVLYNGVDTADDHLRLIADVGNIESMPQSPPNAVVKAASLDLQAKVGSIGTATSPFEFSAPVLSTRSSGSQWLETHHAAGTRLGPALTVDPLFDPLFPGLFADLIRFLNPTGNITLAGGKFYVDQSLQLLPFITGFPVISTNLLSVENGVTLGGNGSMWGNVKVKSGGTIDMGFAPGESGLLQVFGDFSTNLFGNVSFDNNSKLIADINPPYALPGAHYDQLTLTGVLDLQGATLELKGADLLSVSINPIVLIDVQNPTVRPSGTGFLPGRGSLVQDGSSIRANVGQFRGKLLLDGGDGNDVVLNELSLTPPIQNPNSGLPELRLPIYTTTERITPPVQPPPPAIPATIQPVVEQPTTKAAQRFVQVRIVIPIDDLGNVREEVAMELSADWLERLPMILRRLPDDHYRIYLILDSGSEERLVIDVFVKEGRPSEPGDAQSELSSESTVPLDIHEEVHAAGKPNNPGSKTDEPATLPQVDQSSPILQPAVGNGGGESFGSYPGSGGLMVGAAAAVTAVVASRSKNRWSKQVDEAAEVLGQHPSATGWEWWQWNGHANSFRR